MKKVVAYIDGFNLYHAIWNESSIKPDFPLSLRWIDYKKLASSYMKDDWSLVWVYLFTATPIWNPEKIIRHNDFMRVQSEHCGVSVIKWNYNEVKKTFNFWSHKVIIPNDCRRVEPSKFTYVTHEEKQTDVNLSLGIVKWVIMDEYDIALIFTADSDIAPAIKMAKDLCPSKMFYWVLPFHFAETMNDVCDSCYYVRKKRLLESILPNEIQLSDKIVRSPYI